ncbi:MAG: hypothetical protein J5J00_06415 [Deltaproteobacteria bacterium]|nr:hypothetical protein [Deltaproteobacteria bacterium]
MGVGNIRSSGRVRIQDEILNSKKSKPERPASGRPEEVEPGRGKLNAPGQRRKIQDEILNPAPKEPPAPSPAPPVSEPPAQTEARTLAERYVAQYEAQAGAILNEEQRAQKISEVEEFYEEAQRTGRLEKIVFA